MSDHNTATAATAPADAAQSAATINASNPVEPRRLSDRTLLAFDAVAAIVGSMVGHGVGQRLLSWFSAAKRTLLKQSAPATAPAGTQQQPPEEPDYALHANIGGIGPNEEAAALMTLGMGFRRSAQEWLTALLDPPPQEVKEAIERAVKQWELMESFVASKLTQGQRDFLLIVVSKLKTAELQMETWLSIVLVSKNEQAFLNHMKTSGIIRDPNEFTQAIAEAVARGFEEANNLRAQRAPILIARYDARRDAALRNWAAAHPLPAQVGQAVNATPSRRGWIIIGIVITVIVGITILAATRLW